MGHSSLLGTDLAPPEPAGRDTATLGPGDSSDTGSDLMGIDESDQSDPGVPVDVALRDDQPHSLLSEDALGGSASDAAGTGERRAAGSDGGLREAADIGVDRIFTPGAADDESLLSDDADPELSALVDEAQAGDPLEDEEEEAGGDDEDDGEGDLGNEDDNIPKG